MAKKLVLKQFGEAEKAFQIEEFKPAAPEKDQVQIEVVASGLNFADVMARRGMYGPVNKLPFVLGYDVVGKVLAVGADVDPSWTGKKVLSLTRFGGYASHVNVPLQAMVPLPDDVEYSEASSYTTAFLTAYLMAEEYTGLSQGKTALVYSVAGGVGYFLYHFLKLKGVAVQPVVGSPSKQELLKDAGIAENILLTHELEEHKEKYDLIFNARGGKTVKKDKARLKQGGKLIMFGAADQLKNGGFFGKLKLLFGFGFYSPIKLIVKSQSLCGFNLLGLSKEHPILVTNAHKAAVELIHEHGIKALPANAFSPKQIAEAHALLESGKSTGKLFVDWRK
ncbi:MAG: alcohol dehydrogenase catalytic domain-containing protein [Luteibaculum sp.]